MPSYFIITTLFLDIVKTVILGNNPGLAVLMNVVPPTMKPIEGLDVVAITHTGTTTRLVPEWVGEGFPADVRPLLDRFGQGAEDGTTVVTARRMSPGAIKLLAEHHVSWADAAGHAEITTDSGVSISRQKPRPLPRRALTRMNWSPSAAHVVEYVLSRQLDDRTPPPAMRNSIDRISTIAEATHISPGQVAKVLLMLDDEGYTAKFGPERGPTSWRELKERGRLLSDWAAWYRRAARNEVRAELHVLSRDPDDWRRLVAGELTGVPWVVSGWLGADAIAPFTTSVPDMVVYVPDDEFHDSVQRLTRDHEVSVVEQGGRIHLRSAPRFIFDVSRANEDLPLASPVRVYADLLRSGGRGIDAAERLREVAIGF